MRPEIGAVTRVIPPRASPHHCCLRRGERSFCAFASRCFYIGLLE
jgi:hypothetical protein